MAIVTRGRTMNRLYLTRTHLTHFEDGRQCASETFDNIHNGESIFLIGSNPRLYDLLPALHRAEYTFALNRALLVYPYPTYWAAMDYWPAGFSMNPLFNPDVIKFIDLFRMHDPMEYQSSFYREGRLLRDLPNTYFFNRDASRCWNENFFTRHNSLAYFDSTFMIALQLIWRMGFKKVYLCGCAFDFDPDDPYCYKDEMNEKGKAHNAKCYPRLAREVNEFIPIARDNGFEIFRCDEESNLDAPYETIELALQSSQTAQRPQSV